MSLTEEDEQAIDQALQVWRQGDVSRAAGLEFLHFADLSRPHSPASVQVADALAKDGEAIEAGATPVVDEVRGVVMLSQTCDVVRSCRVRPFVEIAPLIEVPEPWVEEIRRLKRPAFAYLSIAAGERLVADLDRTMTVEKAGRRRVGSRSRLGDRRRAAGLRPCPRPKEVTVCLSRRFRCRCSKPSGASERQAQPADR